MPSAGAINPKKWVRIAGAAGIRDWRCHAACGARFNRENIHGSYIHDRWGVGRSPIAIANGFSHSSQGTTAMPRIYPMFG
jgi:hypothetical protein